MSDSSKQINAANWIGSTPSRIGERPEWEQLQIIESVSTLDAVQIEDCDYPVASHMATSAESLERQAQLFGEPTHSTKKRAISPDDPAVKANKSLQKYLKQQAIVEIPSYCRFYITEYALKNLGNLPPLHPEVMERITKTGNFNTNAAVTFRSVRTINGKEQSESFRAVTLLPRKFVQNAFTSAVWRKTFHAVLFHEIVHCREMHPDSALSNILQQMGIPGRKGFQIFNAILELSAHLKELDFMFIEYDYPHRRNDFTSGDHERKEIHLPMYAMEVLRFLDTLNKREKELVVPYCKKIITQASPRARAYLHEHLVNTYVVSERLLGQIGL